MPAEVRSRDGGESGVALITVLALLATLGIVNGVGDGLFEPMRRRNFRGSSVRRRAVRGGRSAW